MGNDLVKLEIDQQTIVTILNKQIQAAIVLQLGDKTKIIGEAVAYALSRKVSNKGTISDYSSENKFDYLEIVSTNIIQEAARTALQEWLKENVDMVKKAVMAELDKPARQKSIAKALADATEESFKCSWNMDCKIDFNKEK